MKNLLRRHIKWLFIPAPIFILTGGILSSKLVLLVGMALLALLLFLGLLQIASGKRVLSD